MTTSNGSASTETQRFADKANDALDHFEANYKFIVSDEMDDRMRECAKKGVVFQRDNVVRSEKGKKALQDAEGECLQSIRKEAEYHIGNVQKTMSEPMGEDAHSALRGLEFRKKVSANELDGLMGRFGGNYAFRQSLADMAAERCPDYRVAYERDLDNEAELMGALADKVASSLFEVCLYNGRGGLSPESNISIARSNVEDMRTGRGYGLFGGKAGGSETAPVVIL